MWCPGVVVVCYTMNLHVWYPGVVVVYYTMNLHVWYPGVVVVYYTMNLHVWCPGVVVVSAQKYKLSSRKRRQSENIQKSNPHY